MGEEGLVQRLPMLLGGGGGGGLNCPRAPGGLGGGRRARSGPADVTRPPPPPPPRDVYEKNEKKNETMSVYSVQASQAITTLINIYFGG